MSYIIIALKIGPLLLLAGYAFTYLLPPAAQRLFRERAIWVMPGLFYLALATPYLPIFLVLLLFVLPAIARTRGEAAALFLVASAGLPNLTLTLTAGSAFLVAFSNVQAMGLGLLAASFVCRGQGRVNWGWRDVPIAIYLVINWFAQARGLNVTSTLRETLYLVLELGIPYVALRRCIKSEADLRYAIMAVCFAAVVQSIIAVYEMLSYWVVYNTLFDHFGIPMDFSRWIKVRGGLMRAHGALPESTSFGWFLAIALTAAVAARRNFSNTLCWGAAIAVIALGLFASGARIGWLAVAIGIVAIGLFRRNYGAVFRNVLLAAVAYAGLYAVALTTGFFRSVVGLTADGASTVEYRKNLLSRGLEEFWHNPLTGLPIADVKRALADLEQGEHIIDFVNAYVFYGLTSGLFGVIAFGAMFVLAMLMAWRARGSPPLPDDAPTMQFAAIVFAVSAFSMVTAFTSGFGGSTVTYFLAIIAGAAGLPTIALAGRPKAPAQKRRPLVSTVLGRSSLG